jgi:hypothetical protein
MNIRKAFARLNARSGSLGGGRGGIPEFTPQDVAAAIGMARDEIGRDIFCFAWWPDGARLRHSELQDSLRKMLSDEYSARYRALGEARLSLHMLEDSGRTKEASRAMVAAREAVEQCAARAWPKPTEKYADIVNAVLKEVCSPRHCPNCGGKGHLMKGPLQKKCERCKGRGIVPTNKTWRARELECSESSYRAVWRRPYEWLYDFVAEHESIAAKQIEAALGQDVCETA